MGGADSVGGISARAECEADKDVDSENGLNNVRGAQRRSGLMDAGEGGKEGAARGKGVHSRGASMASLLMGVMLFPCQTQVRAQELG
jgi:hypothetical protein